MDGVSKRLAFGLQRQTLEGHKGHTHTHQGKSKLWESLYHLRAFDKDNNWWKLEFLISVQKEIDEFQQLQQFQQLIIPTRWLVNKYDVLFERLFSDVRYFAFFCPTTEEKHTWIRRLYTSEFYKYFIETILQTGRKNICEELSRLSIKYAKLTKLTSANIRSMSRTT